VRRPRLLRHQEQKKQHGAPRSAPRQRPPVASHGAGRNDQFSPFNEFLAKWQPQRALATTPVQSVESAVCTFCVCSISIDPLQIFLSRCLKGPYPQQPALPSPGAAAHPGLVWRKRPVCAPSLAQRYMRSRAWFMLLTLRLSANSLSAQIYAPSGHL
jgi:hypothetical protein